MVEEFETTLQHEDIVVLSELCTNIVWLETYILTMENMTNTLYRYVGISEILCCLSYLGGIH